MIAYSEALDLILESAQTLPSRKIPLEEILGRYVAEAVSAPTSLPPFPNSAMDGFALQAGSGGIPAGQRVPVRGSLAAGDAPVEDAGSQGEAAWEIMTGAPVPSFCDAVIPVERVEARTEGGRVVEIRLLEELREGANVRPAGRDFQEGDPVLGPGDRVGPMQLQALAALGIPSLPVRRRPRAVILSTGPELVPDPRTELAPGQIRDSNGPYLTAALKADGVRVLFRRVLGDEPRPFQAAVEEALEAGADLVVSTGAVSMGKYDFVPAALGSLGAELLFHRAAIRPGKPILAARLPGGALHFGLPGNPISATVGLRFFVGPYLQRLLGREAERPRSLPLAEGVGKHPDLRHFTKARVEADGAQTRVRILQGQESFRIAPLLSANAWAVLPEGPARLEAGEEVEVHGLLGPLIG